MSCHVCLRIVVIDVHSIPPFPKSLLFFANKLPRTAYATGGTAWDPLFRDRRFLKLAVLAPAIAAYLNLVMFFIRSLDDIREAACQTMILGVCYKIFALGEFDVRIESN